MNNYVLQAWLSHLGFYEGALDGIWGKLSVQAARDYVTHHGYTIDRGTYKLAAEQLIIREVGGIYPGPIDGIFGPKTAKARKGFQKKNWREPALEAHSSDERFPKAVKTTWPKYSQLEEFFGEPGENLVRLELPYRMQVAWAMHETVDSFFCHEKVRDSLGGALAEVLALYGLSEIQKLGLHLYGGCYNKRKMRGGSRWSTHAWGIALDIDPANNRLRWDKDKALLARPEYAPFWDAFTKRGWLSLGKARDFDWMHVQACQL